MKKRRSNKVPSSFNEPLSQLASRPEFKALEKLMEIEERNILIQTFKLLPGDPQLAIKLSHFKGRVDELRRIRRTFEQATKKVEGE